MLVTPMCCGNTPLEIVQPTTILSDIEDIRVPLCSVATTPSSFRISKDPFAQTSVADLRPVAEANSPLFEDTIGEGIKRILEAIRNPQPAIENPY